MYYTKNSEIYRKSDGKLIAPCQSVNEPDYVEYITWVNAGNITEVIEDTPITEVIILSMAQAKRMLLKAGYLDEVNTVIAQLDMDAQIRWEYEPFVHSDNEFVNYVLINLLRLSKEYVYNLFKEASSL